jgi:hypothetical protein
MLTRPHVDYDATDLPEELLPLGGFGRLLKVMSRSILQSNSVSMPFDDQFLLPRKVTPPSVTVCASLAITLLMVAGVIYVLAFYLVR